MKSIIVYSSQLKAQNLYPRRIISPPAPNKCCPTRMEVLGRPRVDELGRRFCYKRCRVCGFALRYFLEPTPATGPGEGLEPRVARPAAPRTRGPAGAPPPSRNGETPRRRHAGPKTQEDGGHRAPPGAGARQRR